MAVTTAGANGRPGSGAEFTLAHRYPTDRRSPVRWIFSHAIHKWPIWILVIGGAIGNASLAAVLPLLIGQAFNAILASPPRIDELPHLAILLAVSQLARGLLQFCRNFGSELMAQNMEREVRDELYASLLGKSMTFHNLQPVGDTMARATNDVREVKLHVQPRLEPGDWLDQFPVRAAVRRSYHLPAVGDCSGGVHRGIHHCPAPVFRLAAKSDR